MGKPQFFLMIAVIAALAGLVILAFVRPLQPMLREIQVSSAAHAKARGDAPGFFVSIGAISGTDSPDGRSLWCPRYGRCSDPRCWRVPRNRASPGPD